jgi:hypothetical protein
VTSSSGKEVPYDVTIHGTKEGIMGGKLRHKQCPQGTTPMIDHDDGNNGEVGGFGVRHISTTTHDDNHQARLPTDHFKWLLEEAYPNHAYPIKHKLKDYGMVRSFMNSESLTSVAELNKDLGRSDMMPLPRENTVIMVLVRDTWAQV